MSFSYSYDFVFRIGGVGVNANTSAEFKVVRKSDSAVIADWDDLAQPDGAATGEYRATWTAGDLVEYYLQTRFVHDGTSYPSTGYYEDLVLTVEGGVTASTMTALARLSDLKDDLHISGTAEDDSLQRRLDDASAKAAELAGVSSLVRASLTLYPHDPASGGGYGTRTLRLPLPIESITSVKQRYHPSTDWAEVTALTADDEYFVEADARGVSGHAGRIRRVASHWHLDQPHLVQVVGVFGYDVPDDPAGGDAILPPTDLQRAVRLQAIRAYQSDRNAGVREVDFGGDGGSVSFGETKPHPELVAAVRRLPFVRVI